MLNIKSITQQRNVIVFQFESGTKWDNARFLTIDRRTDLKVRDTRYVTIGLLFN